MLPNSNPVYVLKSGEKDETRVPDSRVCNITLTIMATQAVTPFALQRKYLVAHHANRGSDPRRAFIWHYHLLHLFSFLGLKDGLIK